MNNKKISISIDDANILIKRTGFFSGLVSDADASIDEIEHEFNNNEFIRSKQKLIDFLHIPPNDHYIIQRYVENLSVRSLTKLRDTLNFISADVFKSLKVMLFIDLDNYQRKELYELSNFEQLNFDSMDIRYYCGSEYKGRCPRNLGTSVTFTRCAENLPDMADTHIIWEIISDLRLHQISNTRIVIQSNDKLFQQLEQILIEYGIDCHVIPNKVDAVSALRELFFRDLDKLTVVRKGTEFDPGKIIAPKDGSCLSFVDRKYTDLKTKDFMSNNIVDITPTKTCDFIVDVFINTNKILKQNMALITKFSKIGLITTLKCGPAVQSTISNVSRLRCTLCTNHIEVGQMLYPGATVIHNPVLLGQTQYDPQMTQIISALSSEIRLLKELMVQKDATIKAQDANISQISKNLEALGDIVCYKLNPPPKQSWFSLF